VENSRLFFFFGEEFVSQFHIRWNIRHGKILVHRIDIESGASYNHREFFTCKDPRNDFVDIVFPLSGGIYLVGVYNVYLMMRNFFENIIWHFIGSNIHISKNLSAIRRDDLFVEIF